MTHSSGHSPDTDETSQPEWWATARLSFAPFSHSSPGKFEMNVQSIGGT